MTPGDCIQCRPALPLATLERWADVLLEAAESARYDAERDHRSNPEPRSKFVRRRERDAVARELDELLREATT